MVSICQFKHFEYLVEKHNLIYAELEPWTVYEEGPSLFDVTHWFANTPFEVYRLF